MSLDIGLQLSRSNDFKLDAQLQTGSRGFTVLFGPSGCGKTTFLRSVAGLEPEARGHIRVGEQVWLDSAQKVSIPPHRRAVGMVFQESALFPHLSVRENILFGFRRRAAADRRLTLASVTELTGCGHLLDRAVTHLSGGEKQRVAIARALLPGPELLLMDEPLAALDGGSRRHLLPLLKELHAELAVPVLYVTHRVEELAALADRVALFESGRIVAKGDVGAMLDRIDSATRQGESVLSLVEATVEGYQPSDQLAHLNWAGGRLHLPRRKPPSRSSVRVIVDADDVSLCRQRPVESTILNIFPAIVDAVLPEDSPFVLVRLRIGESSILSRITRASARELDVRPGQALYGQIKSVALAHGR